MTTILDIKSEYGRSKCECSTQYCSDNGSTFDNNQGVASSSTSQSK